MIKTIYNTDDCVVASEWVREEIKDLKTYDAPQVSSALNVKQKGTGRSIDKQLGYMVNVSNSVYKNGTDVFIVSQCASMAHGLSVTKENMNKVTTLFTARRCIKCNWINQKDEYMEPNHD